MNKEEYIRNGLNKWYQTVGQKTEECDNDDNFNKKVDELTKEYENLYEPTTKIEPRGVNFEFITKDGETYFVQLYINKESNHKPYQYYIVHLDIENNDDELEKYLIDKIINES